jgi:hypothetical protein
MFLMRLLFLFWFVGLAALGAHASVASRPNPPRPGWPTADYRTLANLAAEAEIAVFDFGSSKKKAFIKDRTWLAAFQQQLHSSSGKPDAYCFCVSYPIVRLMKGDQELVSIQLTHGHKIRFLGAAGSGDFILSPGDYETLLKIERAAFPAAMEFPRPPPANHRPQPARVELKP